MTKDLFHVSRIMANMTYYAIVLSTNSLNGNRFVNAGLGVVVDLVAITLCWYIAEFADRRKMYMVASIMTAVGIGLAPFVSICKSCYF